MFALLLSLLAVATTPQADPDGLSALRPAGLATVVVQGPVDSDPAGTTHVLASQEGRGVLRTVLVGPGSDVKGGRLRVYRDGNDSPSADVALDALAQGRAPGFPGPLAGRSAGLVYSAVPFAFRSGLRVEFVGGRPAYSRVSLDVGEPAGELPDPSAVAERWGDPGASRASGEEPAEYPVDAGARSSTVFLLPPGPRTIRSLEVVPEGGTADAWRDSRLRIAWESDGTDADAPGVDLPLGRAFGRTGGGAGVARSLLVGESAGGASWVNRFPMPYRTQGVLRIDADRPIKGRVRLRAVPGVGRDAGYFRGATAPPSDDGRGHLAGVFVEGEFAGRPPRLSVDGRDLGPWPGALGLPLGPGRSGEHGVMIGRVSSEIRGGSASYRWMAADPITYHVGLGLDGSSGPIENGQRPPGPRAAWFWYSRRPGSGPPSQSR